MEQNDNQKQYKRQDRSVSPEVRRKISTTLKSYNATHPRDTSYRQNLSNGLKSYWEKIPQKSDNPIKNGNIV